MTERRKDRNAGRRSATRRWLLIGVSVAALAASGGTGSARPLNGAAPGAATPGPQTPSANAAAAAALANRQNQKAAQRSRDSLARVTQAVQSMRAVQDAARKATEQRPSPIRNGVDRGGLQPAVSAPRPAALDPTGVATWQGAKLPTEVIKGGRHDVTVEQTLSRAILSWETFNVGKDTTLTFDQDGNKDWVVLNRIVGGLDETGRRTAALKPSEILGSIKADGTVLILNQNGVIFGAGSQIRTNSLAVSTAEIGRGFRFIGTPDPTNRLANEFEATSLVERNAEFLQFGLLGVRDSLQTALQRDLHSEFTPYYDDVVLQDDKRSVARENDAPTGGVFVEAGGRLVSGEGGFILLNSPRVENAGEIIAPEGNVSLVGQWGASLITSNGSGVNGADPNYRGVSGFGPTGRITPGFDGSLTYVDSAGVTQTVNDDLGAVFSRNTGLIRADRGSIRLTENDGILLSTTSVSRNGYVAVQRSMPGSVIAITPDGGDETIPQDGQSVSNFKVSRVDAGYYVGGDALIFAPGGDVAFGPIVSTTTNGRDIEGGQRVLVEDGAVIDVAGLRDVLVPASRNAIRIGPLKGNELADDPLYRDGFLNGAVIYVDPRKSGVRADGVAWIGSPLVEAESYYQQVGVKAEELLTRGGNVRFATLPNSGDALTGQLVSDTIVEKGAVIDISGGSVRYEGGVVRSSQLLGADGRVYDVSEADPLEMAFVGFAAGFTRMHDRWSIAESYSSPLRPNDRVQIGYSEGRDAGSLDLPGDVLAFMGSVKAGVVIGERQRTDAEDGSGKSKIGWDRRPVQGAPSQLPAAGALRIGGDVTAGATIGNVEIVAGTEEPALPAGIGYGRDFAVIDATLAVTEDGAAGGVSGPRAAGSTLSGDRIATTYLSADMLNAAGFGQIEIARGGDVSVETGADLRLADGGLFTVASGGSIRVDGSVTARSGVVALETSGDDTLQTGFRLPRPGYSPYDVVINGSISVRGNWINDYRAEDGKEQGGAYLDGGSIVLFAGQAAANLSEFDPTKVRDISGSVLVNKGAILDVSGGGRVDRDGVVDASAKGGNLALISETNYLSGATTVAGLFVRSQHVNFGEPIVPDRVVAKVAIDQGATVLSHGFGGGGAFQLVTPEFAFGDEVADVGTALPMGFINEQGFSNYEIASYKTKIVESKFRNEFAPDFNPGFDAFLDTQTVTIGAGQTLKLRNSVFSLAPSARSERDVVALQQLQSGGDLYSVLAPTTVDDEAGRDNAFFRQPVNLTFGGLIELKVAKGGAILGEAGAKLTTPRLINEGLIRLPGGEIVQREALPLPIAGEGRAVRDPYDGLVARADGTYSEGDPSQVVAADGRTLTNGEAYVGYLLGELAADVGVELRKGGVTDLSGVSLRDPTARDGARTSDDVSDMRIFGGGRITLAPAADRVASFDLYPSNAFSRYAGEGYKDNTNFKRVLGLTLDAAPGARIDLGGASDVLNRPGGGGLGGSSPVATRAWSDAGGIFAPNGATLTGAKIDAHGGSRLARGGALEIGDLVLTQRDTEVAAANTVSADFLTRSGFDLVQARGGVTSIGDVDLTLGRAFFVTNREIADQTGQGAIRDPQLFANVGSGGALSISADYIRLEGYGQTVATAPASNGSTNSVTLNADQIDVVGAVRFDETVGAASLNATGDIRLVGQNDVRRRLPAEAVGAVSFSDAIGMHLAVGGDLTLSAQRLYPETGAIARVTSTGAGATIRFERPSGPAPKTPYSAGAALTVQAAHIEQNGAIFVPHGSLALGGTERRGDVPATRSVTLGAGSLTSVSGGAIAIPYGVTTDLTEYFFAPGGDDGLDATPEKRLLLAGSEVAMASGAVVDVSGGGDVFAYEFIPGSGGSRDVLDRLNPDPFTSNDGATYPDGRQIYAIVPGLSDQAVAAVDPYFSSGYDSLGQPSAAGTRVYLNGGDGIAAGWYTLLPAKYAVLPGGLRIVEQPGGGGLEAIASSKRPDGTIRVSGRYGQLGSSDWRWRDFDVQTQSTFRSYSNIALTSAQTLFAERAASAGEQSPRLPADAGSLTLNALRSLTLDGDLKSAAAKGGRGVTVDIGGSSIYVVSDPTEVAFADGTVLADGAVVRRIDGRFVLCADASSGCAAGSAERLSDVAPLIIGADDLTGLGAESLLIGGSRAVRDDGAVEIRTSAQRVVVANDASAPLSAPEILLAVGLAQNDVVDFNGDPVDPNDSSGSLSRDVNAGPAKALIVVDGAVVEARGTVADPSTADYIAAGGYVGRTFFEQDPGSGFRRSSVGAVLRVANGPERAIRRPDAELDAPEAGTDDPGLIAQYRRRYAVDLSVGAGAKLSGASVLADVATYLNPTLAVTDPNATDPFGLPAPRVGWAPNATLSIDAGSISARRLTLGAGRIAVSDRPVDAGVLGISRDFLDGLRTGAGSSLKLMSRQAIGFDGGAWTFGDLSLSTPALASLDGGDVAIEAERLEIGNRATRRTACIDCGTTSLSVAAEEIVVGPGRVATEGFGGGVTLAASGGLFAQGVGGLDVGSSALTIDAPVIADRSFPGSDATLTTLTATEMSLVSRRAVRIRNSAAEAPAAFAGVPGSIIAIEGSSVSVSGSRIAASGGMVDIHATGGDVRLGAGSKVEAPGYEATFGDVTLSAPAGRVRLQSDAGDVVVGAGASVLVGGAKGKAGALALEASQGEVVLAGAIDGRAAEGDASILIDTGGSLDLDAFATFAAANNFDGRIALFSGTGDLRMSAGKTLRAESLTLGADGGAIDLAGAIDTSGVNGGDVGLYGAKGVRLRTGARIDTGASGYSAGDSRQARSGSVTIGSGAGGAIALDEGSVIDVAAERKSARLVPVLRDGATRYRYVAADEGGTLTLRAPIIEQAGADTADVAANGRVLGAHAVVLEAFKTWDLDKIVDGGAFTGVARDDNGGVVLDVRTGLDTLAYDARSKTVTVTDAGSGVNLLGDRGPGTVASFIQDFDVSAAYGALGDLVDGPNFHARAGVELAAKGDVTLASNWNLGAGTVDVAAATADGLMSVEPVVGRTAVVFGREAELIRDYTAMTYRTGASAAGEAGALSIRAGGDLTIRGTVSDGFFQFRNQTDADFLSAAMGGKTPGAAPFSAAANSAAGLGDDAAGSAELFPLLTGGPMASFSLAFTAGAKIDSADVSRTAAGRDGDVSVTGLFSYAAAPAARPGAARTAYYRNLIRTGDGVIAIAASGSVDLRGEADPIYVRISDDALVDDRTTFGDPRQIGGAAVYSAGHRASLETREALDPSGRRVTLDLGSLLPNSNPLKDDLPNFTYGVASEFGAATTTAGVLVGDLAYAEGGGDVTVTARLDVLGRRDLGRSTASVGTDPTTAIYGHWMSDFEPWRQGEIGGDAAVRVNFAGFYDGFGTLGGGDLTIEAGRDISDVNAVATSALATGATSGAGKALVTFGSGDVALRSGRDVLGGRVDVSSGKGLVEAGRSIASTGDISSNIFQTVENTLRLRMSDATIDVSAGRDVDLQGLAALGAVNDASDQNAYGFYSDNAAVSISANGDVLLRNESDVSFGVLSIWPGSFLAASSGGDLTLARFDSDPTQAGGDTQILMTPSPHGQLELLAAGDIAPTTLAMSDAFPGTLPGLFGTGTAADFIIEPQFRTATVFEFPDFSPDVTEGERRRRHSETPLHGDDERPVLVSAGRDISGVILATAKETRVSAGRDLVDMAFFGQNLDAADVTRIVAGRDIIGTTQLARANRLVNGFPSNSGAAPLSTVQGNTFRIGGPGAFILEAGRNAGPFLNSATVTSLIDDPADSGARLIYGPQLSYGGGVLSIGDEDNPWLRPVGADVTVMFGVAKGVRWNALRDHYLDPSNLASLDDALFEGGDRSKPIYPAKLVAWLRTNAPDTLAGATTVDAALAFAAFKTLPELRQRAFLSDVYFDEIQATADPAGPSFQQYQRGYQAVNLLFPAELGYTKNDLTGGANGANEQVVTGNLDLRLATIQTSRGGDVMLFGPGGRVLAGSVVRTEQQIARRNYDGAGRFEGLKVNATPELPIDAIPTGFEGLLTVRGGSISSFTDGDLLLNQSRLFTQGGGDVVLWSSNGDLNGGEGPKTSSNFPPVLVDTDYDAFSIENRRGSATGAGIAALQPSPDVEAPDVFLIAPRGTVDAGAAGIRVSGNLNVAAQTVANADNISVGGGSVGVPQVAVAPVGALTAAANNEAGAQETRPADNANDQASIIIVEVLGYGGGEGQKDCPPERPDCKPSTP